MQERNEKDTNLRVSNLFLAGLVGLVGALGCDVDGDTTAADRRGACNLANDGCAARPEAVLVWDAFAEAEIEVDDAQVILLGEDACADNPSVHLVCSDSFAAEPDSTRQHHICSSIGGGDALCCYWGAVEVGSSTGYWGCRIE